MPSQPSSAQSLSVSYCLLVVGEPRAVSVATLDQQLARFGAARVGEVMSLGHTPNTVVLETAAESDVCVLVHVGPPSSNDLEWFKETGILGPDFYPYHGSLINVILGASELPAELEGTPAFRYSNTAAPRIVEAMRLYVLAVTAEQKPPLREAVQRVLERLRTRPDADGASSADASRPRHPQENAHAFPTFGGSPFQTVLAGRRFTGVASQLLNDACLIAWVGRKSPLVSSRALLAAALRHGLQSRRDSAHWLVEQLQSRNIPIARGLTIVYPGTDSDSFIDSPTRPPSEVTPELADIVAIAAQLAKSTTGTGFIGARHLVAALLFFSSSPPTNAWLFLRSCGIEPLTLQSAFLEALHLFGTDDHGAWVSLLTRGYPVVRPRPEPDDDGRAPEGASADPGFGGSVAAVVNDTAAGPDRLGILPDVDAMASLVAAWNVTPPLSIGIFGEWGAGKTFFMHKLRSRVAQISRAARSSGACQKNFGYCKNIVQVEFNAWHYVEGNLWASLVEHIFRNLRVDDAESEAAVCARQARYLAEIDHKVRDASEADARALALNDEAAILEHRATAAREAAAASTERVVTVTTRDILHAVKDHEGLRTEIRSLLDRAGIDAGRLETAQQLRDAINEATATGAAVQRGLIDLWRDPRKWRILIWVLAPSAALLAAWVVATATGSTWGRSLLEAIGGALGAVMTAAAGLVATWRQLSPHMAKAQSLVNACRDKRDELDRRVEEASHIRNAEVVTLQQEAEKKRAEAAHAEAAAQAARREAAALQELARALEPGRRLAAFIKDRADSDDYRRHLGVAAVVRRDFDKLASLIKRQREDEMNEKDGNAGDIVNRIILYVDDLDRCPPHIVVKVLRVLHLLLSFELFVVVVGVDARWLTRSLRSEHAVLFGDAPPGAVDADGPDVGEHVTHDALAASASPADYLEKIFQIPFWIRPIGRRACEQLVRGLTGSGPDAATGQPPHRLAGPTVQIPGEDRSRPGQEHATEHAPHVGEDAQAAPAPRDATSQTGPLGAGPAAPTIPSSLDPATVYAEFPPVGTPSVLDINNDERAVMLRLAGVIGRSPRAVKRFLNCYRLIKATMSPARRKLFLTSTGGPDPGGEAVPGYPAVMALLAVVTGLPEAWPQVSSTILRENVTDAASLAACLRDRRESALLRDLFEDLHASSPPTVESLRAARRCVERFGFNPLRNAEEPEDAPAPRVEIRRGRSTAPIGRNSAVS